MILVNVIAAHALAQDKGCSGGQITAKAPQFARLYFGAGGSLYHWTPLIDASHRYPRNGHCQVRCTKPPPMGCYATWRVYGVRVAPAGVPGLSRRTISYTVARVL